MLLYSNIVRVILMMRRDFSISYQTKCYATPLLTRSQEVILLKKWAEKKDTASLEKLVKSYLRLVFSIVYKFAYIKESFEDLISEGTIALVIAIYNFDIQKGAHLSSYASSCIYHALQDYLFKTHSLLSYPMTTLKKRLFFKLPYLEAKYSCCAASLTDEIIADILKIPFSEVTLMKPVFFPIYSLDNTIKNSSTNWTELIKDEDKNTEESVLDQVHLEKQQNLLCDALSELPEREQNIFKGRFLSYPKKTLNELSKKFDITLERVRQIEKETFKKIKKQLLWNQYLKSYKQEQIL